MRSALSDLDGKHIFHITAPGHLPMYKVKQVSMQNVMHGRPILEHDGTSYGIMRETLSRRGRDKTLLLFDSNTQSYRVAALPEIQTFAIQAMVARPTLDSRVPAQTKPARPQPKHLKMRFRPLGSGPAPPETIGTSSESEGEQTSFTAEKRKRKHLHSGDVAPAPRKKSKKQSSSKS